MCDERERLIEYLYDTCDAAERRRVDVHLASCEGCREEISALRGVRLDLLAWDVPEHGSVWKPFAQARTMPWWREVPVWALAAAVSVMFVLGIGGGLVARQLVPAKLGASPAPAVTSSIPTLQPAPVLTTADQAAMEQRIASTVQSRLEGRVQPVAAHAVPGLSEQDARALVQTMLGESEIRQAQALRLAGLGLLHDSDTRFVKETSFKAFLNNDLPWRIQREIASALAMQQQQGGNK